MFQAVKNQWIDAIISVNRSKANKIIDDWIKENGSHDIFQEILRPGLEEIGEIWAVEKDITFAQVYVATTIAEDTIIKVLEHSPITLDQKPTKIIIGNMENDYHSLGKRLVDSSLRSSGWVTVDLGVDVSAEEFVEQAIELDAKIIMISAMFYSTAKHIKKVREIIDQKGYKDKIKLIVGGAVFNVKENLWKEVGADAIGKNALDAGKIADEILISIIHDL